MINARTEEAIHDVRILERFTFVELDSGHAEQALDRLDGTKLKGKQVRLERAQNEQRPRQRDAAVEHRQRQADAQR